MSLTQTVTHFSWVYGYGYDEKTQKLQLQATI